MTIIIFIIELIGTFITTFVITTGFICLGLVSSAILSALFSKETWTNLMKRDK